MKIFIICIFIFTLFSPFLSAQNDQARESFISPLKLPLSFSGNFGELRPAHFHSGLDIRTGGKTGIPVYASKEGYVSRISVSPTGYGNALYITHPDGHTTLYGHLSRFVPAIQEYVKDKQYYTENYQINVSLSPGEIYFRKGDLIAWSGNTGNSGGPHLHFEVRDTNSDRAENPLFYIPGIKDYSAPLISSIYIYPLTQNSHVNRSSSRKRFPVVKGSNGYSITTDSPIEVYGKIGFGVQASDDYSGTGIRCGIYAASILCDGETVFGFNMRSLSFNQTRYANSLMDYEENRLNQRKVHRLYQQPGNELDIYGPVVNSGVLDLEDGETHTIQILVSDAFENPASLKFKVLSRVHQLPETSFPSATLFEYDRSNKFKNDEVKVSVPKGALYDSFNFFYGSKPGTKGLYSKIHEIHDATVPLHKPMSLSIKAEDLPDHLTGKSLIVAVNKSGNRYSIGGEYSFGWVNALAYEFGSYAVAIDTVAPVITSLSIKEKKKLIDSKQIQFKISDNLSGIKVFRGEIDGHWVLFEFDPKTRIISYTFDRKRMVFNKDHHLTLTVTDNKNNKSEYRATFYK
jgi:hypothetical protein